MHSRCVPFSASFPATTHRSTNSVFARGFFSRATFFPLQLSAAFFQDNFFCLQTIYRWTFLRDSLWRLLRTSPLRFFFHGRSNFCPQPFSLRQFAQTFYSLTFRLRQFFYRLFSLTIFIRPDKLFAGSPSCRLFIHRLYFSGDFCKTTVFGTFDLKTARNTGLLQAGATVG